MTSKQKTEILDVCRAVCEHVGRAAAEIEQPSLRRTKHELKGAELLLGWLLDAVEVHRVKFFEDRSKQCG